ncbi:MAG: coA-transferase family protein [Micavibrio sp.]|nr:coA-transferase family protein [Micavibrio sp.]
MAGPLTGIRVLDLSRILAGPFCTQILGDLGADILKIERPGFGDDTRKWGPPFLKDSGGNDTAESAYYLSCNRNKRSLAVDITKPEGQEIIHGLLSRSDVMIENFKVGDLDRYGLGYDQIKARHPHLIYASITGFGQTGPLASEPGYDFLVQGMGGLMAATGNADEEPMKVGVALSDVMSGLFTCISILAALNERHQSGEGQRADIALLDCTAAAMTNLAQYYLTTGKVAPRLGNAHSTIVPYQAFKAHDGYIILAIGNDGQFKKFSDYLGKSWASDAAFATNTARVKNRAALIPEIEHIIAGQTVAHWLKVFSDIGIPGGPVNTMDQVFAQEQLKSRDMIVPMTHSNGEPINLTGNPIKFSRTKVEYRLPPPSEGAHTNEILTEILGLNDIAISNLTSSGVIK